MQRVLDYRSCKCFFHASLLVAIPTNIACHNDSDDSSTFSRDPARHHAAGLGTMTAGLE
jgi:hypothetical protein